MLGVEPLLGEVLLQPGERRVLDPELPSGLGDAIRAQECLTKDGHSSPPKLGVRALEGCSDRLARLLRGCEPTDVVSDDGFSWVTVRAHYTTMFFGTSSFSSVTLNRVLLAVWKMTTPSGFMKPGDAFEPFRLRDSRAIFTAESQW